MKKRLLVTIPNRHPATAAACVLMGLSAVIRLWHYLPSEMTPGFFWIQVALPVAAAVILLGAILFLPRLVKEAAIVSTVLGVTFFICKATGFAPVYQALCTVLYLGVLVLFCATVLGWLPTKKLLYPLFGLPLIYHILVEDTQLYFFADPPVPVWDWMPEISVLCIMGALLCLSVAMQTAPISEV